jgi:hypothetical protein
VARGVSGEVPGRVETLPLSPPVRLSRNADHAIAPESADGREIFHVPISLR